MGTIFDYLDWRGDLSLEKSPFNEVDNYIVCKVGCPNFTGIIPADERAVPIGAAVDAFFAREGEDVSLGALVSEFELPALRRLPDTVRFRELRLSRFIDRLDPDRQEQFSALTVWLPDGTRYVSFRGTDDTLLAWKENFLMSVEDQVAAQQDAADYLLREAESAPGPLLVGGHSKGGNLAVFAAMHAPEAVQNA